MATENPIKKACRGWESPIEPYSDGSNEGIYSADSGSDENTEYCRFAAEALSNFVVLRNIFSFISNNDLESCSQVNQFWKTIADPLIIRYYEIHLVTATTCTYLEDYNTLYHENDIVKSDHVVIKKLVGCKKQDVEEKKCSLQDACKFLAKALLTDKVAINLVVRTYKDFKDENVDGFVTLFGHIILSLCTNAYLTGTNFCERFVRDFPNLQVLDLTRNNAFYIEDEQNFDTKLIQNQLKHLKRLNVKGRKFNYQTLTTILRMAPSLEEVYNFPLLSVKALALTGKAGLVKSLDYPEKEDIPNSNDETFETALEALAELQPKLSSFSFDPSDVWPEDFLYSTITQPFVQSLLQSSHSSLTSLTMYQSESFDFQAIPSMTSLQEIKFMWGYFGDTQFFPENVVLQEKFPSVSAVQILTYLYPNFITTYFPESVFSPWGAQIRKLKIYKVSSEILHLLKHLFPNIQDFEFHIRAIPDNLETILPLIAQLWPGMEVITVEVGRLLSVVEKGQHCTLDSVFTGIPDDVLVQLKDPGCREKFSQEEMQIFREASPLRRLTKLKTLKFDCYRRAVEKLSTLTPISKEFGFQFLPGLKVVVRTSRNDGFLQDMKTSLEPLVNFEVDTY